MMYPIVINDMANDLKLYDVVLVKKKDIKEIKIGDMIAYVSNAHLSNGMTLMHRVVGKKSNEETGEVILETKWDKGFSNDEGFITADNLLGIVEKRIPFLGRFLPIEVWSGFIVICNLLVIFSLLLLNFVQFKNRKNKI